MFANILIGLQNAITLPALIAMNFGVFFGIVIGALPGLGVAMGVTVMLPFVFGMETNVGLLLLLGIYCGGTYGGSITAILIKTPGTEAAAVTVIDGYELTKQGKSGKALDMALIASTIGGLISAFTLLFFAPLLAHQVLRFGPPEFFSLGLFGLTIIASVSGKSVLKGLLMGILGVTLSTVGVDMISGGQRFTFDIVFLYGGLGLVPSIIGLFSVAEILLKSHTLSTAKAQAVSKLDSKMGLTRAEFKESLPAILRSSVIGTVIGAIPAAGAVIASFISYSDAKRRSKHPELFGHGSLEGVAAPEAGNNAVTASCMIPMFTLGIPGSVVAAIILGALMMNGLIPGPGLFRDHAPMVYSVMVGMIIINIFMFLQGKLLLRTFVSFTKVLPSLLMVLVLLMCLVGTFAVNNTLLDLIVLIVFALFGYVLNKLEFPLPPVVLGMVLGPLVEKTLRQSLLISDGDFSIFVTRPISIVFLLMTVLSVFFAIRRQRKLSK